VAVRTPSLHPRALILILALPLTAGACLESGWTICTDDRVCEPGQVCDTVNHTCSSPREECLGKDDLVGCAGDRVCLGGKCKSSCGDGVLDGADECEGIDLAGMTCADMGWYEGDLACGMDCRFDPSACSGKCMDGQFDQAHETCDPSDFDPSQVASCVALGFDAGRQGCRSDCASLSDAACARFGWTDEDPFLPMSGEDSMQDMWGTGGDVLVLMWPGGVRSAAQGWVGVGPDGDDIVGRAIWASSAADIWVINQTADGFVHWDGAAWNDVASPAGGLNEIWGSSASDIFAVGDGGVAVHFDGSSWTAQPTGAGENLRAIWGARGDEVYAAGDGGRLLRFDGGTWSSLDSGATEDLTGVWADGASDIWTISAANVRRYDGSRWVEMLALDGPRDGRAWISATGPSDVWISTSVGVTRYDGRRWSSLLKSPSAEPLWVDRSQVAVGFDFLTGAGTVRRWFGAGNGPALDDRNGWFDVWALDPDVWIAAGSDRESGQGIALHADGRSFPFDLPLEHVSGFTRDHAYAATSEAIFEWNGSAWSVARDGGGITDLWTAGSEDVYALVSNVGGGLLPTVAHFDGRTWSELPPLEVQCELLGTSVRQGWASGPEDVFVVGTNLLARFDGSAWTYFNGGCLQTFESVWGSGPGDVWAFEVSRQGASRIHHWDGASWTSELINGAGPLVGSAADDVFLGSTLHYDGRMWSPLRSSAITGTPVSAVSSRLFTIETAGEVGLGQFVRTRFWNQRSAEADCGDGVDDDADGATDADDDDCATGGRDRGRPTGRAHR